jgi:hypothetical protein
MKTIVKKHSKKIILIAIVIAVAVAIVYAFLRAETAATP